MKTALITTTINVPAVLALYRISDSDVMFFVTGDRKTPDGEVVRFLNTLGCYAYYGIDYRHKLGWKCSQLLGENTDSRRNIALLEALKWGADIIVSVDDDMIPMDADVFAAFEDAINDPFNGLQLGEPQKWFNHTSHTFPATFARGIPTYNTSDRVVAPVVGAKIGVVQGSILGIPDKRAEDPERMWPIQHYIHSVTDMLHTGFVAHPLCWSVFNSQFTAFRRELAPGFAQFYKHQKRNTDIFASVIMRRVMRELNLYTFYGPPFGYHNRIPPSRRNDYDNEKWGMARMQRFVEWLDKYPLYGKPFDMFWQIYARMKDLGDEWLPIRDDGLVWLTDCGEAMK